MHVLTGVQNLFDQHDSASHEGERLDALAHDDQSLMGEIGSARRNLFNDTTKKHVLMCILSPYVSNRTHQVSQIRDICSSPFGHVAGTND